MACFQIRYVYMGRGREKTEGGRGRENTEGGRGRENTEGEWVKR